MNKLYIVGTPIGNLSDFSPRGIKTLSDADFIAAEDTRVSGKLLKHFDIVTPMVSYHQHNQKISGENIIKRIQSGESCALITDAGMPAISDPGQALVNLCNEIGICVEVIPGPTALACAVALSGFYTRKFIFEGFLEGTDNEKIRSLEDVKNNNRAIVYYEAPHRLLSTLGLMYKVFGDRKIAICRELTKLYEQVLIMTFSESLDYYSKTNPKGEFVLVVEGAMPVPEISFEEATEMVVNHKKSGMSLSDASREVAEFTGHKKGRLYKAALNKE